MRTNNNAVAKTYASLLEKTSEAETASRQYITEQDQEVLFTHLRFAEKLFPKNGIGLCPISHTHCKFFSQSCERILGHPHRELSNWELPDFFAQMHPDDLPAIQQCFQFIGGYNTGDPEAHRFAIHLRLRNKVGEYSHIKFEHLAIKISDHSYMYLILFSDISREEKFHHVKLDLFKAVNNNFIRIYTYNPQQKYRDITPRQHDIAKLVIKGFTNQEIADHLGVSVYTVKNHKQMLFKKVNVRSSMELANYVKDAEVV